MRANPDNRRLITSMLQITVSANIRNHCDLIPFQAVNGLADPSEIDDDSDDIHEILYTSEHGSVQMHKSEIEKHGNWTLMKYYNKGFPGMGAALAITGSIYEKHQDIR